MFRFRVILLITALMTPAVGAQTDPPADPPPDPPADPTDRPRLRFEFDPVIQYDLEADIDGGGTMDVTRLGLRFDTDYDINQELSLKFRATYELSAYNFSASTALGADPWSDIHMLTLDTRLQWRPDPKWIVFGGPIFQFSRESGASWEDAFIGGVVFGGTYVVNPKLVLGAGVVITSQLEDSDPFIAPLLVVNWRFTDSLYLTSVAGPANVGATGLELVWQATPKWTFGTGFRIEYRRFRLDDSGVAPGGVGQDTHAPVWVRASYTFTESFTLDLYAGLITSGELTLEDSGGNRVSKNDYDPAPAIALAGRIRF